MIYFYRERLVSGQRFSYHSINDTPKKSQGFLSVPVNNILGHDVGWDTSSSLSQLFQRNLGVVNLLQHRYSGYPKLGGDSCSGEKLCNLGKTESTSKISADICHCIIKLIQSSLLMSYLILEISKMFDNISLFRQIIPGEGQKDFSGRFNLAVKTEQARIVLYELILLGHVKEEDQLQELLQSELVQGFLVSLQEWGSMG